jgi:CubicO group peptidase (beta-lactamase class C family)
MKSGESAKRALAAALLLLSAMGAAIAEESPRVTPADWYWGPANRWSWQNMRRIFPTANISRGTAPAAPLKEARRDLSTVTFTDPVSHRSMTVEEMLGATYTDGFIVLKDGAIVFERYLNGLTRTTPHLLMSITKSFVGTLTGILAERGQIDPQALVTDYLPELKGTVFEGAKVRNLLDMTVAAKIGDDPYTPIDQSAGWLPGDASSAAGLRKFLATLKERDGSHGTKFIYLDPSPQAMAWII